MTAAPHATRMIASNLAADRERLARDAQDIAATATRLAEDVESGLARGDHARLAQALPQFLMLAARHAAMKEVHQLYLADLAGEGQ